MAVLSPAQIKSLLREVGFPENSLNVFTAILLAESGGNTVAVSSGQGTDRSYGIAQVAGIHGYTDAQLADPKFSLQVAYQLSNGGTDFTPWDAYQYVPTPGCTNPSKANNYCETKKGPGLGSFANFLGIVDSTIPLPSILASFGGSAANAATGRAPETPISKTEGATLLGFGPGNIIPSISDIWNGVTGVISGVKDAPAAAAGKVAQAITQGVVGSVHLAWVTLAPLLVRTGFFFLGIVVMGIGGMILAAPQISTTMQTVAKDAPEAAP